MEDPFDTDSEFWRFLVEAQVLDRGLAEEFRKRARDTWLPLGQVLVQRGQLDVGQITELLAMQVSEPHLRIGDLAVREGWCSKEDIADALATQRRESPHPIELLLADSRVDTGTFFGPLIEYVRWLEGRVYALTHPTPRV